GLERVVEETSLKGMGENINLPVSGESFEWPSYDWEGRPDQFEEFLDVIRKLKICRSTNSFAKLFECPQENLALKFNLMNPNYVLQFFICLKDLKLVSALGDRFGFYQVLQAHVVDFESVV
ncbi:MAG: hypothetical protein IH948_09875, partial [Bacteroidetes bacterium]|nr:hypothetical protein [Bacteroidota bacterium]